MATDDYWYTDWHATLTVSAAGVLGNDSDPDGDPLTVSLASGPTHGTLSYLNSDGSFEYVPEGDYSGGDSFTYTLSDGTATDTGTVDLDVGGALMEPESDDYSVLHDSTLSIDAPGVLANDMGQDLQATLYSDPSHGTLEFGADGSFDYTPHAGYVGTDSFQYEASNWNGDGGLATVTIDVYNAPPYAENDQFYFQSDEALTVYAPGVRENDSDPDEDEFTAELVSEPSSARDFAFNPDGSFLYEPQSDSIEDDSFTYRIHDGAEYSAVAMVSLIKPKVDIDVAKINRGSQSGVLSEDDEFNVGAYIPLNNDDDDYDDANTPDMNQEGAVTGETDLLPIFLRAVEPAEVGGTYTIDIPGHIRVWKNPDRTEQVRDGSYGTSFPATDDTTLYVEGINTGRGVLKINWGKVTSDNDVIVQPDADRVTINVFEWYGTRNVPGHARYSYVGFASAEAKWLAPVGGQIASQVDTTNGDSMSILWDEGPVVGKAVYQAHSHYIWDFEVNVVQVEIESQSGGSQNSLTYENPPFQDPGDKTTIASAIPDSDSPAIDARLMVSQIRGPEVNGQVRGVKYIQAGFIQNVRFTAQHAHFHGDADSAADDTIRKSNLESLATWHLDMSRDGTAPWADTTRWQAFFPHQNADQGGDRNYSNRQFFFGDTPVVNATDVMTLDVFGSPNSLFVRDNVDSFHLLLDFKLYFAVRTTDDRGTGAAQIYTQRARANWHFNGSGTINSEGQWIASAAAGTGGDNTFSVITDGTLVPVTGGTPANWHFDNNMVTWESVPDNE